MARLQRNGALPRPKRVIVSSPRSTHLLDPALFRDRGARRAEVSVVDAPRLDGDLMEHLNGERPAEVYFDLGAEIEEQLLVQTSARLLMSGVAVHFILPGLGRPALRPVAGRCGSQSVISFHPVRDGSVARIVRRVIDVVGAASLLVLLSPLLSAVALLVWSRMGRPIFFAQQRLGRSGKLFPLYKFRSMINDADCLLRQSLAAHQRYVASNFKLPVDEDHRITPLGRFLRRASLDELPQLWNVLRGDMSLVGPRAIVPDELDNYGDYAPMLLRIKPGLTGPWQVGGRSAIGYPERARIDLHYVQGRSLRKDLKILVRTLPAVIRQRGAF